MQAAISDGCLHCVVKLQNTRTTPMKYIGITISQEKVKNPKFALPFRFPLWYA
jgi:hypothetical protein